MVMILRRSGADGQWTAMEYYSLVSYRQHHQGGENLADKAIRDEDDSSTEKSESDEILSAGDPNPIGCEAQKDSKPPPQGIVELNMDISNTPLQKVKR